MDEIKVSIIIPLYNGKNYIRETVNSFLKIKSNKEIIIVDDGSSDGSYEYCKSLWGNNDNINIFRKENGGIVDARNYGMRRAKGEYLLFSDQDDIAHPKVIDKACELSDLDNVDGIMWSTERRLPNCSIPCDTVVKDCLISEKEINTILIPSMLINRENEIVTYLGHIWAGMYKRKLIEDNKIYFKKFVDIEDDYLFVFDFLNVASKLGFMQEVGYEWRYNPKSETYRLKYIAGILKKYEKFYGYLTQSMDVQQLNANEKEQYEMYKVQNTLVMSIENSFTYLNNLKAEQKEIKEYYKCNKRYFNTDSIFPYDKRRKRIYICLKYGMFRFATTYIYLDSLYRKIKCRL